MSSPIAAARTSTTLATVRAISPSVDPVRHHRAWRSPLTLVENCWLGWVLVRQARTRPPMASARRLDEQTPAVRSYAHHVPAARPARHRTSSGARSRVHPSGNEGPCDRHRLAEPLLSGTKAQTRVDETDDLDQRLLVQRGRGGSPHRHLPAVLAARGCINLDWPHCPCQSHDTVALRTEECWTSPHGLRPCWRP